MSQPETSTIRDKLRSGESTLEKLPPYQAELLFIGSIETPFKTRLACPRQGSVDGPECRIHVDGAFQPALVGLDAFTTIEVLYWMHEARRDLLLQSPKGDGTAVGTFALRSPLRPNPIATALVSLVRIDGATLIVRGLDCLDGTPLLDIKPDRCAYTPLARSKL